MECNAGCDFTDSYELSKLPAMKAVERQVLGCDYGGTSWTTAKQVPHILSSLRLDAGKRLLEAGCGAGWPALYVSRISGCSATLLDMPLNALQQAAARAQADGTADRVALVNGSATDLPLADGVFDGIGHSDVLCCLAEKREMLEECRRVIKDSGRMHFSVIRPAHGLDETEQAVAEDLGPPYVAIDRPYSELLGETGWRVNERVDLSDEYAASVDRLVAGLGNAVDELEGAFGPEAFADNLDRRSRQAQCVRDGILVRVAIVAEPA